MSQFKTVIPIDVKAVIGSLPKGSSVLKISLREDLIGVEVIWDNDWLKTPYAFPVDYPDPTKPLAGVKIAGLPAEPADGQMSGHETVSSSTEPAAEVEARPVKNKRRS